MSQIQSGVGVSLDIQGLVYLRSVPKMVEIQHCLSEIGHVIIIFRAGPPMQIESEFVLEAQLKVYLGVDTSKCI